MTRTKQRGDVAWGMFYDDAWGNRLLMWFRERADAVVWKLDREHLTKSRTGPIFKITPPRTKPRKGRSK